MARRKKKKKVAPLTVQERVYRERALKGWATRRKRALTPLGERPAATPEPLRRSVDVHKSEIAWMLGDIIRETVPLDDSDREFLARLDAALALFAGHDIQVTFESAGLLDAETVLESSNARALTWPWQRADLAPEVFSSARSVLGKMYDGYGEGRNMAVEITAISIVARTLTESDVAIRDLPQSFTDDEIADVAKELEHFAVEEERRAARSRKRKAIRRAFERDIARGALEDFERLLLADAKRRKPRGKK